MDKNNIHQYALGVLTYLISMDIVRGAVDSLRSANKIDEHSFNLITFEELIKAIRNKKHSNINNQISGTY